MYREGQIKTLKAAIDPLERRLDAATHASSLASPTYSKMQDAVGLLTLSQALDLLPQKQQALIAISIELNDSEWVQSTDWEELLSNWDHALWCFVLYIMVIDFVIDESKVPEMIGYTIEYVHLNNNKQEADY